VIGLAPHPVRQGLADRERIAVQDPAVAAEDGPIPAVLVVPAELLTELVESRVREVGIEIEARHGLLHQSCGDVPGVQRVQGRHLRPRRREGRVTVGGEPPQTVTDVADQRIQGGRDQHRGRHRADPPEPLPRVVRDERADDAHDDHHPPQDLPERLVRPRIGNLTLEAAEGADGRGVGRLIHPGALDERLKRLGGQPSVRRPEVIPEPVDRFEDILDQKNVPRAFALISADAVKGMRVV